MSVSGAVEKICEYHENNKVKLHEHRWWEPMNEFLGYIEAKWAHYYEKQIKVENNTFLLSKIQNENIYLFSIENLKYFKNLKNLKNFKNLKKLKKLKNLKNVKKKYKNKKI